MCGVCQTRPLLFSAAPSLPLSPAGEKKSLGERRREASGGETAARALWKASRSQSRSNAAILLPFIKPQKCHSPACHHLEGCLCRAKRQPPLILLFLSSLILPPSCFQGTAWKAFPRFSPLRCRLLRHEAPRFLSTPSRHRVSWLVFTSLAWLLVVTPIKMILPPETARSSSEAAVGWAICLPRRAWVYELFVSRSGACYSFWTPA